MKHSTSSADECSATDLMSQIEFAVRGLDESEAARENAERLLAGRESVFDAQLVTLDFANQTAVAALAVELSKINLLKARLANTAALRQRIEHIFQLLIQAKTVIQKISEPRHPAESAIWNCFWEQKLGGLQVLLLADQVRRVRNLTNEVMCDLRNILSERRGAVLTPEERRDGVLRSGAIFLRRLSPVEVQNGVTDE